MNNTLILPFIEAEVLVAVNQIHPTKAPGTDGLSTVFFHTYWKIVRRDVVAFCLDFLNTGGSLEAVNETNIIFIPKN